MSKKKPPALVTIPLKSERCDDCQFGCAKMVRCRNCGSLLPWERLDEWEMYGEGFDGVAICPACDVPMPSYAVVIACEKDIPADRRSLAANNKGQAVAGILQPHSPSKL